MCRNGLLSSVLSELNYTCQISHWEGGGEEGGASPHLSAFFVIHVIISGASSLFPMLLLCVHAKVVSQRDHA